MAHFIGMVSGTRGEASRTGSKNSGLRTDACSWQGKVVTRLSDRNGVDWATVSLEPHHGQGVSKVLYSGPVSGEPDRYVVGSPLKAADGKIV